MPTSYHMVHYRHFEMLPDLPGRTLETLCRLALSDVSQQLTLWERVEDRVLDLKDGDGRQLVLNRVVDLSSAVFGEMCLVHSHGLQALLERRASNVKLSNITTAQVFGLGEKEAPKGSQFIKGMAYWIAIGNHFFFVKNQSMTQELIKSYIEWLLKQKSKAVRADVSFNFQAEFDPSTVGGDIGDIKRLRLSGKSVPQLAIVPADAPERDKLVKTARRVAEHYAVFEQAKGIADLVLGVDRTNSLVESLGPDEYLSAEAEIKINGRRTTQSKEKMKQIANEVANMTDAKVQVEGKDGIISNDDAILRTRMPFDLESDDSNLLIFENVSDQLQLVYKRFVEDSKILA